MNDSADLFAVYERLAHEHRVKLAMIPYVAQFHVNAPRTEEQAISRCC